MFVIVAIEVKIREGDTISGEWEGEVDRSVPVKCNAVQRGITRFKGLRAVNAQ